MTYCTTSNIPLLLIKLHNLKTGDAFIAIQSNT